MFATGLPIESERTVLPVLGADVLGVESVLVIGPSMKFVVPDTVFSVTAGLLFLPGAVVYAWMEEAHPAFGTHEPPPPATGPSTESATDD